MDVFLLEENKSRHLPLVEEGGRGLPAASILDGLDSTPLGFSGETGASEDEICGNSEETGAGEDGGDLSYSSSEQEKSSCSSSRSSSSEQSSTGNPSRDAFVLFFEDPSASLAVLVPSPLEALTTGGRSGSTVALWGIEPSSVPRADLSPRTSEPPWFVWDGTGACGGWS
jgi:hypothetical protein